MTYWGPTQGERILAAIAQKARNEIITRRFYMALALIAVAAIVVIAWKV